MIRLSAFADEISPDLDEQIAVLHEEQIHFLDLRSVWGTNVLNLTDQQVSRTKAMLDVHGIGVAAIGSPIGKIAINEPFDEHFRRFEHALALAQTFHAPAIRIFSFYPPYPAIDWSTSKGVMERETVLRHLTTMVERARSEGIILLLENEKRTYGDTIARTIELLEEVNNPHLRAAFDPANYLECGQIPYPEGYEAIRPWLGYVHVKDISSNGSMVVTGEGMACWPEILVRLHKDGYDGFLSLEPHLKSAGQYQGFSGSVLFHRASQALHSLLDLKGVV
jgi:3-dehydroshikimate dehydratase